MTKAYLTGGKPRINVAVEHYTSRFPRGLLVTITHCDPQEPLDVLFYADTQHLQTVTITASHSGEAHVSLHWQPNTPGRICVRSKVNNDTTEIHF